MTMLDGMSQKTTVQGHCELNSPKKGEITEETQRKFHTEAFFDLDFKVSFQTDSG